MKEYIAFDSHKHYTLAEREMRDQSGCCQHRIDHRRGAIRDYLSDCEAGTPVAVEATANWYWIVEEIEEAGLQPLLIHPQKAKLMMGLINKTDSLDVHGFNLLQRNQTLPTVWIAPPDIRDLRELTRVRLVLARQRTKLKNRITSMLSRYALQPRGYSDPYGRKAREELQQQMEQLPEHTRWAAQRLLEQLDFVSSHIEQQERRLLGLLEQTPQLELLQSLPGIGLILAATILFEIGDIERFPSAGHLAGYSGTVPRVHASGGKTRFGRLRPDVNRYLRWAFAEAGNSIALNCRHHPQRHVSRLYKRLKARKNHSKAIGAVARHLAEATFHVLSKAEPYRDPAWRESSTREV